MSKKHKAFIKLISLKRIFLENFLLLKYLKKNYTMNVLGLKWN